MSQLKIQKYSDWLHSLDSNQLDAEFISVFSAHPTEATRILKCAKVAQTAHRNQRRKSQNQPYFVHLFRAALMMYKIFEISDVDLICATLLHDAPEDTNLDQGSIVREWGVRVGNLVASVTKNKPKIKSDINQYNAVKEMYETLKVMPEENRLIWFFDNVDNMYDFHTIGGMSKHYRKVPRWMAQARDFYLPNAKYLGQKYFVLMKRIYDQTLAMGFEPIQKLS